MEGLAQSGKSDVSAAGFWVFVSKAMGATWTPKQCQSKWCVLFVHLYITVFMHFAGLRRSKGKHETKIRGGIGQKTIAMSSFASRCPCIVDFVSANHKYYIGSLLSILTTRVTLTGSPSVIPHGTCGAAIPFGKNGGS